VLEDYAFSNPKERFKVVKERREQRRNKKEEQRKSLERVSSQQRLCHIDNKGMTLTFRNPVSNPKNTKIRWSMVTPYTYPYKVPVQPSRRTGPRRGVDFELFIKLRLVVFETSEIRP